MFFPAKQKWWCKQEDNMPGSLQHWSDPSPACEARLVWFRPTSTIYRNTRLWYSRAVSAHVPLSATSTLQSLPTFTTSVVWSFCRRLYNQQNSFRHARKANAAIHTLCRKTCILMTLVTATSQLVKSSTSKIFAQMELYIINGLIYT